MTRKDVQKKSPAESRHQTEHDAQGVSGQPMPKEMTGKPRRRIVFIGKIEADSWRDLQHTFTHLATEIARHDHLPAFSVSGGYSVGHIIVTSVDGSMDHDKWANELNEYLDGQATKGTSS